MRGYISNALFEALYLDDHTVVDDDLNSPFDTVAEVYRPTNNNGPGNAGALSLSAALDRSGVRHPLSSSQALLAEDTRFE